MFLPVQFQAFIGLPLYCATCSVFNGSATAPPRFLRMAKISIVATAPTITAAPIIIPTVIIPLTWNTDDCGWVKSIALSDLFAEPLPTISLTEFDPQSNFLAQALLEPYSFVHAHALLQEYWLAPHPQAMCGLQQLKMQKLLTNKDEPSKQAQNNRVLVAPIAKENWWHPLTPPGWEKKKF